MSGGHVWIDSSQRPINIGDLVVWPSASNSSGHMNYGVVTALKIGGGASKAPKVKVLMAYNLIGGSQMIFHEKLIAVLDRMIVLNDNQLPPKTLQLIRDAQVARVQKEAEPTPNEFSHPTNECPSIEQMIEGCDHKDDYGSLFLDGQCMLCGTKEIHV